MAGGRSAVSAISRQTSAALQQAMTLLQRDEALQALRQLLDPDDTRAAWWIATQIEKHLQRFQRAAWQRIETGHRQPQSEIEQHLLVLSRTGCPSARRLWDLLQDFDAR